MSNIIQDNPVMGHFIAKSKGFEIIFTSVKNENLINRFKECGYVIGSENTKELMIKL